MTVIGEPRDLPQVEVLARTADGLGPAPVVRAEARRVVEAARRGLPDAPTSIEDLECRLAAAVIARRPLQRVINATGVMLHTNLGRAPLDPLEDGDAALGPVPLEMELGSGRRGRRLAALEADICDLTGAEAALVVNNNAAALLLVLSALASGGEVVVSRGQLVEIGGSFRVPEIVTQGGAVLREVGTTNRTHVADIRDAICEETAVLLQVHPSNFAQVGFVASVSTEELAELAAEHGLHVVHDIGSGLLDARTPWYANGPPPWLLREPAARQELAAGADVVTFSGDKLLGGPQAGIICGTESAVERIRIHPLARALRFDKVRAAHLHACVRAHLDDTAEAAVPFHRMATASLDQLEKRACAVVASLDARGVDASVVAVEDSAGAGSAAAEPIPGRGVAVAGDGDPAGGDGAAAVTETLRRGEPPVLAVVRGGRVRLSMRTVDPGDDGLLVDLVAEAVAAGSSGRGAPG